MNKANVVIHKAKLKKGVTLVVEYTENDPAGAISVSQTCTADVHPDLLKAFHALAPHLAALCEQYDRAGVISDKISFRGFTVKGEEEKEGVILTGLRTMGTNKALLLNSPFQRFGEETEDVGYEKIEELLEAIETAKDEVLAYLADGKHAPDMQGNLFGEGTELQPESEEEED